MWFNYVPVFVIAVCELAVWSIWPFYVKTSNDHNFWTVTPFSAKYLSKRPWDRGEWHVFSEIPVRFSYVFIRFHAFLYVFARFSYVIVCFPTFESVSLFFIRFLLFFLCFLTFLSVFIHIYPYSSFVRWVWLCSKLWSRVGVEKRGWYFA